MQLQLHNTLTRRKEVFAPIDPARVRMYVCGPTVYDYAHIGNARPVVVFDVLFRLMRRIYGNDHVTYVRNITDVDDKIIERARESGEPIESITKRTAQTYMDDMAALNALEPSVQPRATQHIGQMIAIIEKLIARENAYVAEGHVLFHVPSDPAYGKLSGRSRDDQIAGARIDVAPYKRDPADFVLWKPSTAAMPGWDSPWGRGRPGWHIECSAMSAEHLGTSFDIHGGGQDLIFPHHENEIAQSECAHGAPMASVWMHNGFLELNSAKMSKSLGNFFTVRELLEKWPGEAIRLLLLKTHYRAPLDFTEEGLRQAKGELDRFYRALAAAGKAEGELEVDLDEPTVSTALADDLNTPQAIARLHSLADDILSDRAGRAAARGHALRDEAKLLGLLASDPTRWFARSTSDADATWIEASIAARVSARQAKDFAESDRIRDDLKGKGVILEDGPKGTTWRRA